MKAEVTAIGKYIHHNYHNDNDRRKQHIAET